MESRRVKVNSTKVAEIKNTRLERKKHAMASERWQERTGLSRWVISKSGRAEEKQERDVITRFSAKVKSLRNEYRVASMQFLPFFSFLFFFLARWFTLLTEQKDRNQRVNDDNTAILLTCNCQEKRTKPREATAIQSEEWNVLESTVVICAAFSLLFCCLFIYLSRGTSPGSRCLFITEHKYKFHSDSAASFARNTCVLEWNMMY